MFQSPEGDSLFFYTSNGNKRWSKEQVSVPRRGFVVFLQGVPERRFLDLCRGFSPPKGIRCFSTATAAGDGSLIALFQSPEGDSLFFYDGR